MIPCSDVARYTMFFCYDVARCYDFLFHCSDIAIYVKFVSSRFHALM